MLVFTAMDNDINTGLTKPILQPIYGVGKRGIQYEKAAEAVGKMESMFNLRRGEEVHLEEEKRI